MSDAGRIEVIVAIDILGLDQFDQVAAAAQRMGNQLLNAGTQGQQAVGRFEQLRQALDALERKLDGVFRAGFRLQAAGRDLMGVGQTILGFLGTAVDAWGDYEFMLNRAAGAMGVFETQGELYAALTTDIQELAKELRIFPAEDVAKATYFWASTTGQQVESAEDLKRIMAELEPIMATAAMTQTDYESAVKTAYNVTEQFNLGLDQSGDVIMKLLLMTQRTAGELGDFQQSLKYLGPVAAELKVPFDDIVIALGMVADEGIRGSQAGRALRQFFIQTLRPSAKAAAALDEVWKSNKRLGKSFEEMIFPNGKYVGLEEHVRQLAIATMDMTDAQRGHFLATISTANELPVLMALVNRQTEALKKGTSAWDEGKYSLDNYKEAFQEMFDLLRNSWKGMVGLLQNTFLPLVRKIGQSVAEMSKPWIEAVAKILDSISEWMATHEDIVNFGVRVAALVGILLVAAGAFLVVVGSLILFGAGIWGAITALGLIMTYLGPFILAIGAIGAIVVAVGVNIVTEWEKWEKHLSKLKLAFMNFWKQLGYDAGEVKSIWQSVGDFLSQMMGRLMDSVLSAIDGLTLFFTKIANNEQALEMIRQIIDGFLKLITLAAGLKIFGIGISTLAGMAMLLGGAAVAVGKFVYAISGLKALVGVIRAVNTAFLFLAANPIVAVLLLVAAAAAALWYAWENNLGGIRDFLEPIIKAVVGFFENLLGSMDGIVDGIGAAFDTLAGLVKAAAEPWIKMFKEGIPKAIEFFRAKWDEFTKVIGWGIDAIQPVLENLGKYWRMVVEERVIPTIQKVLEHFGKLVSAIRDFLGPAWEFLVGVVKFALSVIGGIINFALKSIEAMFLWFCNTVMPILEPFFKWIIDVVTFTFQWIGDIISAAFQIIQGIFEVFTAILTGDWGKLWDGIVNIVTGIWEAIVNTIKFAWELIMTTIGRALQWVINIFINIGKRLVEYVVAWWNLMVEWGGKIIKGLWDGIIGVFSWLWNNISGFFTDLWNNILGFFGIHSPSTKGADLGENIVKGIWDGISGLATWLWNSLATFVGSLWDFFTGLPGKALQLGKDVVEGIWEGIKRLAGWLWDKVSGFMEDLWNDVITFWDNGSPSRRMMGLGNDMIEGLAIGIIDDKRLAEQAMMDTMTSLDRTATRMGAAMSTSINGDSSLRIEQVDNAQLDVNVNVESKDGSVTSENAQTIAQAIQQGLMLDRLEHMVAVY